MASSPYRPPTQEIAGDPTAALIAQVNRFAGMDSAPIVPTNEGLSLRVAARTVVLLQRQTKAAYDAGDRTALDVLAELVNPSVVGNPITYVSPRVAQITYTLAAYGDSLRLPVANEGITKRDPRFTKKRPAWQWALAIAGIGAAATGAALAARKLAHR